MNGSGVAVSRKAYRPSSAQAADSASRFQFWPWSRPISTRCSACRVVAVTDKSILGCRYGSSQPQRDTVLYADLYREGRLLLDELVTETYPVEDFAKAADDAHHGRVARGVLVF